MIRVSIQMLLKKTFSERGKGFRLQRRALRIRGRMVREMTGRGEV